MTTTRNKGPSGDKFNTLIRFATLAMQQGMIWVGLGMIPNENGLNRLSYYFGAGGQAMQEPPEEAPNEVDKKTGEAIGRRVAEVTKSSEHAPLVATGELSTLLTRWLDPQWNFLTRQASEPQSSRWIVLCHRPDRGLRGIVIDSHFRHSTHGAFSIHHGTSTEAVFQ